MRPFYVFDRWGKQVGTIVSPLEAVHKDVLNGEDSLTLTITGTELDKGQRIVWRDKFQRWHEHTVSDVKVVHSNGELYETAYCENSIAELLTDYLVEVEPRGVTSTAALERALGESRWQIGTVQPTGTHDFSWYHISAYEAVTDIVETFGAELTTTIEVRDDVVVSRKVDILNHRGDDYGHQFTFGRNLAGIERTVSTASIYTALYGYGKGSQQYDENTGEATGGHSRKLTFGDVNGGVDWVGDEEARLRYGVPDGKGGVKHAFGQVDFSDCEDPDELLQLTREALKTASKPQVSYSGEILNLAAGGYTNGEDSQPGDTVYLRDKLLDERLQGRVMEVERDLLDESNTKITLGNIKSTYTQKMAKDLADLDWLKDQSSKWNDVVVLPDAYLDAVVNRLNILFNTTGGYVYYEKGEGLITYDRPVDQNPTMAIQITGAGFRIANSKNSDGSWNWRTFGTGDGFTADEIITGIIKGGSNWWNLATGDLRFEQGSIASTDGENLWNLSTGELQLGHGRIHSSDNENFWDLSTGELQLAHGYIHDSAGKNYWNLDTGELKISSGTQVGNLSLSDYVQNESKTAADQLFDERMTQQEIFNTLTNGGSEQGIYLQGGRVYINSTYIGAGILQAGRIQDRQNNNYWDLETGELRLSVSAKVGNQTLSTYVSGQATTAASTAVNKALDNYVSKNEYDSLLTFQKVFNALTHNGVDKGLFISGNQVFFNGDFVRTGIIQSQTADTFWDLNNGFLESVAYASAGGQSHRLASRLTGGYFALRMDQTNLGLMTTVTSNSDPNYHPFVIKAFTDLLFSAPSNIGVCYESTQQSYVTWYTGVRSDQFVFVSGALVSGYQPPTLHLTKTRATVRHGMLTQWAGDGEWALVID